MRVCCVSDLHGTLPEIPECDLLLIAGDLTPTTSHRHNVSDQAEWINTTFAEWVLDDIPVSYVAATWGNHDFVGEKAPELINSCLPIMADRGNEFFGLKVWCTPWQPHFYDWAFNAPEGDVVESFLASKWAKIPDDTDILVVHGPPRGYGDLTLEGVRTGSQSLLNRINEVCPALVVTGHIHESYGQWKVGCTTIVNASILDRRYRHVNKPVTLDI